MLALEPDFHFKPPVELYNLVEDPEENCNLADALPGVVQALTARLDAWVSERESQTGLPNPIHHQGNWHGLKGVGPFTSSQQAYDSLHIGDASAARRLRRGHGSWRRRSKGTNWRPPESRLEFGVSVPCPVLDLTGAMII